MQKVAFFSPYIPNSFGGGEKHLLDVAAYCAAQGMEVTMAYTDTALLPSSEQIADHYQTVFGGDVRRFAWTPCSLATTQSFWKKLAWTKQFDVLYVVSDGSFFVSRAKQTIAHIQIPFTNQLSWLNWLKLQTWSQLQTNSDFTKSVIERSWRIKVDQVINPTVDDQFFRLSLDHKQPVILSVGRFFSQLHSKRQDVLIEAFLQLQRTDSSFTGWKLLLVGGVEDQEYFQHCQQLAQTAPVEFITTADRTELRALYERARLYWHATGYGIDEQLQPEKVEHFGISTVEALASGTVPLAVGKGGQKEILTGELALLQWQTIDQLVTKTVELISEPKEYLRYQQLGRQIAQDKFGHQRFEKQLAQLFL